MRISQIAPVIVISLLSLSLVACKDAQPQKSSFGEVDPMVDGQVLAESVVEDDAIGDSDGSSEDELTSDTPSKTSKQLDPQDLPDDIKRMADLCDAINMGCVENQSAYSADDTELIWHCVHLYVTNCTDKIMGFTTVGDYYEADPRIINDVIYAMFGRLRELPQLPELSGENDGDHPHIQISNDLKYRFTAGDRGSSEPEIRRVTQYSDGSMEMEVALVDLWK